MDNVQGKMALITGASSGIGKELATIHAERGGNLIIVARRADKLNELKAELESKHNVSVHVISKDIASAEAAKALYDEIKAAGLQVDYLINNAGFGGQGYFHERDWDRDLSMINLNVTALTALCRHFLPDFVARNSGRILNVSSTASLMPGPLQAVYFATKAFVTSFSNAIAGELEDTNITVTALLPGPTESEFGASSGMDRTPMFSNDSQFFSARVVAEAGYNAMLRGELNMVAGVSFAMRMLAWCMPFLPKRFVMRQIRRIQSVKA